MRNLVFLIMLVAATAHAQRTIPTTDLRMLRADGTQAFRYQGDTLTGFDPYGAQTSQINAATGAITGQTVSAGYFTGNGAGLTNLKASNLASGTIPDARLGSNIPRLETSNVGSIGFSGGVIASTLEGNGAAITNLNASNIASGTVPNARLDSDLTALGNNATNGLWARTGAGTGAARTITGSGSDITVTNGNGVSGNPIISAGSNLAKFNSSTLPFTANMLELGTGYAGSNAGLRVWDSSLVDNFDWTFNGAQNYWQTNKGAGIYASGGFVGSGTGLTGVGKTGSANTWTGVQTFNGGAIRGTILSTASGTPTHTITPGTAYITFNLNVGSPTIDLSNGSLPVGTELWGTIINNHASNQITFDSGSGNNVHAPGFYGQTWAMPTAMNVPHRWFKLLKMTASVWSIDTGQP